MVRILAEMYQTNHSAISLESLYPAIDSMASYLCDGLQHDSHELIVFLSLELLRSLFYYKAWKKSCVIIMVMEVK